MKFNMEKVSEKFMITEGKFDSELLKKVLPAIIKDKTKFVTSTGYSSAISKAKSLSIRLNKSIILVLDSDTNNANKTEEKKEEIEYIFKRLGKEHRVKIFLFQPEIEVIFLESKKLRSKFEDIFPLFSSKISLNAKKTGKRQLLDNLTQEEIESLRVETSLKVLIELCTKQ